MPTVVLVLWHYTNMERENNTLQYNLQKHQTMNTDKNLTVLLFHMMPTFKMRNTALLSLIAINVVSVCPLYFDSRAKNVL